jgi:hypothetical protein
MICREIRFVFCENNRKQMTVWRKKYRSNGTCNNHRGSKFNSEEDNFCYLGTRNNKNIFELNTHNEMGNVHTAKLIETGQKYRALYMKTQLSFIVAGSINCP